MKNMTTISDVSKALGVPTSTLRYWDKQGLLRFDRNDKNNYREFSFETMVDICDIILFRELEIPLDILKKREEMTSDSLSVLFSETKQELESTIKQLKMVIKRISLREEKLATLQLLKKMKPTILKKKMLPIHTFNFTNRKLVQNYLEDPTQSADILNIHDGNQYTCGIFSLSTDMPILRQADTVEKKYLHTISWTSKEVSPSIDAILMKQGLKKSQVGEVIFQYLTSLNEESIYKDYFEVWIELL